MQNLVDMGEITHKMFSLFIDLEAEDGSVIKFGGYDESGIASGHSLKQLKSTKEGAWTFDMTNFNATGG